MLGKPVEFKEREDGDDHSAYWIHDAVIAKPGRYTVEAAAGDRKAAVTWEVFDTAGGGKAKNVILFIGDGLSIAHRTAARILSKGLVEGRYGGELAMDDMPHMALVSTSGTDSVVTDSANSMTAYTTGHKSCVNALGVYCALNKHDLAHPKVETIAELVKRSRGMAVGVVTNTEIEDATPAGHGGAHPPPRRLRRHRAHVLRGAARGDDGRRHALLPAEGDARIKARRRGRLHQEIQGGRLQIRDDQDPSSPPRRAPTKLLGLFNTGNIDGALDRFFLKKGTVAKFPDQPDLTDQMRAALDVLSPRTTRASC